MKFKVGDTVKIRKDLSLGKRYSIHLSKSMLLNKGKKAKIIYIDSRDGSYQLDVDDGSWWWSNDMLEPYIVETRKLDLEDGDYCVFKNKDKAIKKGEYVVTDGGRIPLREYSKKLEHSYNPNYDIVRVDRPVEYKTIYKNDEILDSTEKKYLAAVIAPFRDNIRYIEKRQNSAGQEYINIMHNNGFYDTLITLPAFKSGTMYIGMKEKKFYSLEELGL